MLPCLAFFMWLLGTKFRSLRKVKIFPTKLVPSLCYSVLKIDSVPPGVNRTTSISFGDSPCLLCTRQCGHFPSTSLKASPQFRSHLQWLSLLRLQPLLQRETLRVKGQNFPSLPGFHSGSLDHMVYGPLAFGWMANQSSLAPSRCGVGNQADKCLFSPAMVLKSFQVVSPHL